MNTKKLISDYLESARLMQVATTKDNQSWTCTVYFAFDDENNLYWISLPTTRHSKELRGNEKVSGTIVLPHGPGDNVRGMQFQGVAKELTEGDEFQHALDVYAKRMGMKETRKENILNGTDGHTVYKIHPTLFVLFDTLNFPENPRQEIIIK
ncbi:MAG TPA: pyridoxamine 5'-phosphate oxidase family protein [Candidatus Saccharimonadales bacterium]|nr:pyridoxamine 5'-phosphate oxidase family protein [Candidatus Saccharimonadales bacterium]